MNKHIAKPAKGVVPPPEIVEAVRRMTEETGTKATAGALGIGVQTVRAICGPVTVSKGTLALVERSLAKNNEQQHGGRAS